MRAPLVEAIEEYLAKGLVRGHMPGHKGRAAANGLFARWGELAAWDLTEAEGLDDLHAPVGAIAHTERLFAEEVGAGQAFFLINGASVGILAGIMGACARLREERPELRPEEVRVVLPRNAHRSAWNAVSLAGCAPVWLRPQMLAKPELTLGVATEELAVVLKAVQNVAAVFFVHPSFYGICVNLAEMLAICREHGVISVVDEAHGAHFPFVCPELSAVRLGGDVVIDSWHKNMGSLGQTAVLLVREKGLARSLGLGRRLSMLQSTSPSYPLLASLDMARAEWGERRQERREALIRARERLAAAAGELTHVRLYQGEGLPDGFSYDKSKALLYTEAGYSGWQLGEALRQGGIEPELADWRFALLLLSYMDGDIETAEWQRRLQLAERDLLAQRPMAAECFKHQPGLPEQVMPPGEAMSRRVKYLPLRAAAGEIGAELLTPYPPGIPWVGPGERISREIVEWLAAILSGGGRVQGLHYESAPDQNYNDCLVAVLA